MPQSWILRIKRAETPFYANLKRIGKAILRPDVPVPRLVHPLFRLFFGLHAGLVFCVRFLLATFYITPLFRGRCESSGRHLIVRAMPFIMGHSRIYIGDEVSIEGKMGIYSGHVYDDPTLRIGNRVSIGHAVEINVSREIVIEDDVLIAGNCSIADSDSHPLDPELRAQGLPPFEKDIRPVRIGAKAWLGEGCQVRKGVSVGKGAVIGARSVVLSDIPDNCIAIGNPAKVVGFAVSADRELVTRSM
jgi:acetyltransferase-like isoleucine patch superfamily enzyme